MLCACSLTRGTHKIDEGWAEAEKAAAVREVIASSTAVAHCCFVLVAAFVAVRQRRQRSSGRGRSR